MEEQLDKSNTPFKFSPENNKKYKKILSQYPKGMQASAVMPLLYLAQDQEDFISNSAIEYIANLLDMPVIKVYEVAKFYTMFKLSPTGKYLIQVCRTTPCWLCKSEEILQACIEVLGIKVGETTEDFLFTLEEIECLGACVNAPVVRVNNDYYENLTYEKMKQLLLYLRNPNTKER